MEAERKMRPMMREHGQPTRSSWLYGGVNGGPCSLSCLHCFYKNASEYAWYDMPCLIARANKFRHYYGLEATDISGGEFTEYHDPKMKERGFSSRTDDGRNRQLEYLIEHCANIGLAPSLITHAGRLTEAAVKGVEDARLDCWEFSLHGLGRIGETEYGVGHKLLVVGHGDKEVEDHFEKMIAASKHCTRPIRWNCSVTGQTYRELPAWADFLIERYPPTVGNMIVWMSYDTWGVGQHPEWQKSYREYAPYIAKAVTKLEAAGFEANVRYIPLCIAHEFGFADNAHQHYQIQTDPWEWDIQATQDVELRHPFGDVGRGVITEEAFWDRALSERIRICDGKGRQRQPFCKPCQSCTARNICEGPDLSYLDAFGPDEYKPVRSEDVGLPPDSLISDINHFLHRGKPVEEPVNA